MSHQILRIRENPERVAKKKNKNTKKTLPGFPRLHLTYVGCPERAESTTAKNPFPHDIPWRPCRVRLGFTTSYDMLANVDSKPVSYTHLTLPTKA